MEGWRVKQDPDVRFWVVVGLALAFKLLTSKYVSPRAAAASLIAGVGAAWLLTDPVLDWFELAPETYGYAVAGLLALAGENIGRGIVGLTIPDVIAYWRGGGGGK